MVNFKVDIKRDYSTHGVESLQMDSGRGNMGQEWSGVLSVCLSIRRNGAGRGGTTLLDRKYFNKDDLTKERADRTLQLT